MAIFFETQLPTIFEISISSCLMFTKQIKSLLQKIIALQFLVLGLISSCTFFVDQRSSSKSGNKPVIELTISAAASMQNVLAEIKELYRQNYPQVDLTFNFASSGLLQHQIEQGAPIDIFISAAPQQMDILESKQLLLVQTRQDLVQNQMVLIVPKENQAITTFVDLTKEATNQVALGEPSVVPAGQYAREILSSLNIDKKIESKSIYGKNVRQVLNYVATGNVDAGIVYLTDAKMAKEIKIIATANQSHYSTVVYPAAVVKDSNYPEAAQRMLEFLVTPEAQAIFKRHGFGSIDRQ